MRNLKKSFLSLVLCFVVALFSGTTIFSLLLQEVIGIKFLAFLCNFASDVAADSTLSLLSKAPHNFTLVGRF